ncbi:hypothetical protein FHT03_000041 [Xanthomonas arboricola]
MKISEFFEQARIRQIEPKFYRDQPARAITLSNEAMFHLPLIAMTVLMISKSRTKPSVSEIGQVIGDCFEQTFAGFRGSAQNLGWSASLRVRTVQALSFLEMSGLVQVDSASKTIAATELGKRALDKALVGGTDLAVTLVGVGRAYRNLRADKQLRLGIV